MNPLFYPTPREIGWIEAELESFAVAHRRHKASNQDAFREKLHAEAVQFLQHQGLISMPFRVLSRGGRR